MTRSHAAIKSRLIQIARRATSLLFSCVSALCLAPSDPALAYNSEEHKLMADAGASEVVIDSSIVLPGSTGFRIDLRSHWRNRYTAAKELAAGFSTNDPADYDEDQKGVQDNCYWTGYYRGPYRDGSDDGHDYNVEMYIPEESELTERVLVVESFADRTVGLTFGELVALYGDYRRTVACQDGACYLTNKNFANVVFEEGSHPSFCPGPVPVETYLSHMGSGVVPPFPNGFWIGIGLLVGSNTAEPPCPSVGTCDEEYDEVAWWGDEMLRIATTNDWHFSSGAFAWYVGMHRLALLYVKKALDDPRYWNQALHYEASGLHSLTDLFAFGHVVVDRSTTSFNIIEERGLRNTPEYRWMENVLSMGSGVRMKDPDGYDGRIRLSGALPSITDQVTERNDLIDCQLGPGQAGWGNWARAEEGHHTAFNGGGASVINMRGRAFRIFGDGAIERTTAEGKDEIKGAVRASVQSLFDAYVDLKAGRTVAEIGREGSAFFAALNYIPVYVWEDQNSYLNGMWTDYAYAADRTAGTGVRPHSGGGCVVPYINGRFWFEDLEDELGRRSTVCTQFPPMLSVLVTDGLDTICMGDSLTYTIRVINNGPQDVTATNVVLADSLAAGAAFLGASSPSGSCNHADGVVTCALGSLAFGDTATVAITAAIGSSCEEALNLAIVTHSETDRNIRDTDTTIVQACVALDIKPGSCRNPVNFKGDDETGNSVVPAAILGTDGFDVRDIDVSSLLLIGVAPIRSSYGDVSGAAGVFADTCRCHGEGGDGYDDLTLKFDKSELIQAMYNHYARGSLPPWGEKVILNIRGELRCGAPLVGFDCVLPLHVEWPQPWATLPYDSDPALSDGEEHPGDAVPILGIPNLRSPGDIRFSLPEDTHVKLEAFDVAGRLVSTIIDGWMPSGEHVAFWAGRGRATGIYFLRLTTDGHATSRKIVFIH